ncbi:MAG TPA: hypothetical protein VFL10_02990 [Ornithinibacter sp.]|nr:hypothetical protein [Ornithinibacter sp.]
MRRGRLWVGVVATALVALSGTAAQAVPSSAGTSADAVRSASAMSAGAAVDDAAGAMHVLPARRVLDTRSGLGAAKGARSNGSTTSVTVLGAGGVPASGVGAVAVHVTVTGATGSGYVTAHPGGTVAPTASTLNVVRAQNVTNLAVVPVGADGSISLRFTGTGTVQLLADVVGWTTAGTPTEPGTTATLAPVRLMDTRTGLGGRAGALTSGGLARLQVTGANGLPSTVGSVTLNVTVVTPTAAGWLAVTPTDPGAGPATTSSVNFVAGQSTANAVTTAVSPTGTIDLRLSVGAAAHVVVDALAWTVAGTPTLDGALTAHAPTRLLDTRAGARPTTGAAVEVTAGGTGGVVLNVTAVGASAPGYVTVSGSGSGTPNSSQLSFPVGAARAALVYVPGTTNGRVRLTLPASGAHLVVDEVATVGGPVLTGSTPAAVTDPAGAEGTTVGTRVTWTAAAGAASVVVRRKATGTPRSPFDGSQVFAGPGTATSFDDHGVEPWHTVHYAVFARDAQGNWSEAARTDASGAPLRWSAGTTASAFRGMPTDVSCPTATWCMAVDQSGHALHWNGTSWSAPTVVAAEPDDLGNHWMGFRSVSCPTTHFCLGSLIDNRLATYRDGTWAVTTTGYYFGDVSCWSETGCGLAIEGGTSNDFARWSNGTITGLVNVAAGSGGNLSCPTSTCFLGRANGPTSSSAVYRIVGSTVSGHRLASPDYQPPSVSCTSATWCMVTTDDQFATMSGSTWSGLRELEQTNGFDVREPVLSCASPTSCVAVGISNPGVGAARWNGSTWSIRNLGAGWNTARHVDCATTSACMVVDARGRFNRWTGSSWTSRTTFDLTRGGVQDLDCTSASSCLATDQWGNALSWAGGTTWSRSYLSESGSGLDCSGSLCMTVDGREGTWRARKSGAWGATSSGALAVYPTDAVLCPSSSRCFSFDSDDLLTYNGSGWSTEPTRLPVDLGSSEAIDGDCPTTTFCMVFNEITGASMTWNGTRWTSRGKIPVDAGAWAAVDCLSSTFCVAKGYETTAVFTGSSWHTSSPSPPIGGNIACRTTTHCILVDNSMLWSWDGSQWSQTGLRFGGFSDEVDVTCVGTSRCVVASGDRIWWTL